MDAKNIKKFTLLINTAILFMVFGLMAFFYLCKANFLIYFSIPTIFVYVFGYVLIVKRSFAFYVRLVYIWITIYMGLTTVCLGYEYGFCLYSLSMIPIIYYTNYIAYKLEQPKVTTSIFTAGIIACYLASTGYAAINGPVYKGPVGAAGVFWFSNSMIVFFFMVTYTMMLIKTTTTSEEKLKEMSYTDRLTGLNNRHYMVEKLSTPNAYKDADALSMIDIDNFKKINDVYGHNAGDYILKTLADIMRSSCDGCVLSRWGGEEFLILLTDTDDVRGRMEALRKAVEDNEFVFEGQKINVTITVGYALKENTASMDKWVQKADEKLYYGKNNGKNMVVG
ncbi:MAG: GGDEF domain-containing protein [Lachnospiraceae bacterium]|nr:GGDEF domain-containing protein [Lachnospiraceae bacterium]